MANKLIEQSEAAKRFPFLGSSTNQYRLRRNGELPFIKSAGRIWYRAEDIEAYIESRLQTSGR